MFSYGQRSKCADLLNGYTGGPENVILALLFCVIVIPVMLYGYALILKYVRNRNKRDN